MARILLLIAAVIISLALFNWIKKLPPNQRWKIVMIVVGIVLLGLVLTGRLHWLFALLGALLPAVQRLLSLVAYLPMLKRMSSTFTGNQPSSGQTSQVETRYLQMQLDHDSGTLTGSIKSGLFAERELNSLSLDELKQLHSYYAEHDEDSRLLLENYLQRNHGNEWQNEAHSEQASAQSHSADPSVEEAYAILGLTPNANKQEIIAAHKRLMQKLHPDRGGSSYLAVKINQAKDVLINHTSA